jgi:hypothetical protein
MRRLLICPKSRWEAGHKAGHFHPISGSHYIDLDNGLVLVSVLFKDEWTESAFIENQDVANLPDPVFEGTQTMIAHRDDPARRYTHEHHEALKKLGVKDEDTVLEVSKKAQAIHPLVCIKHIL